MKVLSRRLVAGDPTFATRFKREVRYAEALDHPHVLELYEAGETPDGTLFFAMQYVDGPDLGVLRRDGPMSLARTPSRSSNRSPMHWTARTRTAWYTEMSNPATSSLPDDPDRPHAYLTDSG